MALVIAAVPVLLIIWLALAVARNPSFGVGAFMAMFALDQLAAASFPAALRTSWLVNAVVGAIVCGGAVLAYRNRRARRTCHHAAKPVHCAVISLFAVSAISTAWTPAAGAAVSEWAGNAPYLLLAVFVVPMVVDDEEHVLAAGRAFVLFGSAIVVSVYLFGEWGYRSFTIQGGTGAEVRLPLALSQFCGYFILHVIFLLERRSLAGAIATVVALAAAVIMVRTGSRGQVFGLAAALALLLPAKVGDRGRPWGYFLALAALPAMLVATYYLVNEHGDWFGVPEFSQRWSLESMNEGQELRAEAIARLVNSWADDIGSTLLGLGNSASFSGRLGGSYPHNVYLEVMAEEGAFGVAILLFIAVISVKYAGWVPQVAEARRLHYLFLALVLYEAVLALKQGSMLRNYQLWMFIIIFERLKASSEVKSPQNTQGTGGVVT
jgi:hypothetical protein